MILRTAARALIVKNEMILLSKCFDKEGIFYVLPGGGIESHELAHETLVRECLEETGYTIEVGELVFVKEFIKKIDTVPAFSNGLHQIELIFLCHIDNQKPIISPTQKDSYQLDLTWIPLSEIHSFRVFPTKNLGNYIKENHNSPRYLYEKGDDV